MPLNSLGQYTPNHKTYDHVGNIFPNIEHSEGFRSAINYRPADWLPVQFFDKYFENWIVVTPGKAVALDNQGRVCPAGYGVSGCNITYTSNDVDAGVIDVRTGAALLTANIGTFAVSSVSNFMGLGVAMAVSKPIGVAPMAYLQWAGGDGGSGSNPANMNKHNYMMQSGVPVLFDYVIELPLVPAVVSSPASLTFGTPDSTTKISVATAVANLPVARNTSRTPITFAGGVSSTYFTTQQATAAACTAVGDWHINYDTGVVSVYYPGASGPTSVTMSYYHYDATPSTVSKFACALGDLAPGAFVKCDTNSNFVLATTETFADIIGQVLDRDNNHPKDGLDRVRTAFATPIGTNAAGAFPGTLGQLDQMPGSANGGVPSSIHYSGAADTVVRINLVSR